MNDTNGMDTYACHYVLFVLSFVSDDVCCDVCELLVGLQSVMLVPDCLFFSDRTAIRRIAVLTWLAK